MNLFSRIAIGTANWGAEYNGRWVPEKDVEKILGYAQCNGIDTLDCATAYGWDWTQANSFFNKVIKVRRGDDIERVIESQPYCIMAHDIKDYTELFTKGLTGVSLYAELPCPAGGESWITPKPELVQVPYSLYDRRMERYIALLKAQGVEVHVRSIFLRGKIIEDGIEAEECIKFVLANPYIDKIIIGADSFDQFRRDLDFLNRWKNLEKHDEKLLDPRKWE
jgi:aryl-alcohol dehydrogenase-like predicted oxidoreductase